MTGVQPETAANASLLTNRPTITESTILYSCDTNVPNKIGMEKINIFKKIGPSAKLILPLSVKILFFIKNLSFLHSNFHGFSSKSHQYRHKFRQLCVMVKTA
jgi:hypothetical protein